MRRVQLDLKDDDGREAFLALAAAADVVVESFRPGVVDRLGIGYEAVSARNPGIVYCSTSGYGQDGPRVAWAGHDLDYLAVGGYLAMSSPGTRRRARRCRAPPSRTQPPAACTRRSPSPPLLAGRVASAARRLPRRFRR